MNILDRFRWQVPFRIWGFRGYFTLKLTHPLWRVTFITKPVIIGKKS